MCQQLQLLQSTYTTAALDKLWQQLLQGSAGQQAEQDEANLGKVLQQLHSQQA